MIVKILRTGTRDSGKDWNESNFKQSHPTYEEYGLLYKINSIIEWDFVKWPKKLGEDVEDRDYLAPDNMLKPGDAFSIGESGNLQIIRIISEDKIGLEHTETGGLALERLKSSIILPEILMFFNNSLGSDSVEIESFAWNLVPSTHQWEYKIPYDIYKIFSDRFFPDRDEYFDGIKIIVNTDMSVFPIECYLYKSTMKFNEEDVIEREFIEELVKDLMSWFYNNFERLKVIEKESNQGEKDENLTSFLNSLVSQATSGNTITATSNNTQPSSISTNNSIDLSNISKKTYHWSINKLDNDLVIYLVEKTQWNTYGCMDSCSLDDPWLEYYLPFPQFSEAVEGVFSVDTNIYPDENSIKNYINNIDIFEYNQDFDNFCI